MIIKKKFSKIKKLIDEAPEQETLSIIDDVVNSYEDDQQQSIDKETIEEYTPVTEEQEEAEEEIPAEETEQEIVNEPDLDLSLQNIQFEQREERREGTRRRGYRRSQDRNIVTRAQQDAISIRDIARREGYNEGIQKAQADLADIKNKLSTFFNCKEEVYNKVSGCILDIALQIAKKIINKEIDENREYIIPMIKGLIDEINKGENKITLKVAPKDVEILKDKITEIFSGQFFEAKISVIPDNSMQDGGVIIETSNGIIDASINTQLKIMEQALKKQEASE